MLLWQTIKVSDLSKIHLNRRGLFNKHFYGTKSESNCIERKKTQTNKKKKKKKEKKKKKKKKKERKNMISSFPIISLVEKQ